MTAMPQCHGLPAVNLGFQTLCDRFFPWSWSRFEGYAWPGSSESPSTESPCHRPSQVKSIFLPGLGMLALLLRANNPGLDSQGLEILSFRVSHDFSCPHWEVGSLDHQHWSSGCPFPSDLELTAIHPSKKQQTPAGHSLWALDWSQPHSHKPLPQELSLAATIQGVWL